ncbi:MAG: hypothetical protein H6741_29600 [Alphaproteobacteria bacterium]|nr:hypothetical protein [Alphaproteobacteria bacterium]
MPSLSAEPDTELPSPVFAVPSACQLPSWVFPEAEPEVPSRRRPEADQLPSLSAEPDTELPSPVFAVPSACQEPSWVFPEAEPEVPSPSSPRPTSCPRCPRSLRVRAVAESALP